MLHCNISDLDVVMPVKFHSLNFKYFIFLHSTEKKHGKSTHFMLTHEQKVRGVVTVQYNLQYQTCYHLNVKFYKHVFHLLISIFVLRYVKCLFSSL